MSNNWIELQRTPYLPRRFFWQARGYYESLSDYAASGAAPKEKITDVSPFILPRPKAAHPLLVAEIPNGKLIGDTVLASTQDDLAIGGLQGLHILGSPKQHWLLRRRRFRTTRRVKGAALLLSSNGSNYYHWLFDSLPRLELLKKAGHDFGRVDWILLGNDAPPFQEETLNFLHAPREKYLRCSKSEVLQFDTLIAPSMPTPHPGIVEVWLRKFLRENFRVHETSIGGRAIYLSRRNISRRRMVNEEALERRLSERGFEIIVPEKLTVMEQMRLFASASLIVSPHGAALSNIVFANRGTKLVELFHPEHTRSMYRDLAEICEMDYSSVIGKNSSSRPSKSDKDDRDAEFAVEIEEIMNIIGTANFSQRQAVGIL